MGGEVNIGVLMEDGSIVTNLVYTSSISAFFDHSSFANNDLFHYRKFLKLHSMDDSFKYLAPHGYGLVFANQKNKKIYSSQGYTSISQMSFAGVAMSARGARGTDDEDFLEYHRLKNLVLNGYVSRLVIPTVVDGEFQRNVIREVDPKNYKQILEYCLEERGLPHYGEILLDYGYFVRKFDENTDGLKKMYLEMIADGIKIDRKSRKIWAGYILDMVDYDEDEEDVNRIMFEWGKLLGFTHDETIKIINRTEEFL